MESGSNCQTQESDSSYQTQESDSNCQTQKSDSSYQTQESDSNCQNQESDSSCQTQKSDSSYQTQDQQGIEESVFDLPNKYTDDSKKYDCEFCQKQFTHKASLSRHKKRHQELSGLYFCDFCGANFTRLDNCKKHEKTKHLNKDSNTLTFKNNFIKFDEEIKSCDSSQVIHHSKMDTTKVLKCDQCTSTFRNKLQLEAHLKKKHSNSKTPKKHKPGRCEICDKIFTRKASAERHWEAHHSDEHRDEKCPFCPYTTR